MTAIEIGALVQIAFCVGILTGIVIAWLCMNWVRFAGWLVERWTKKEIEVDRCN